MKRQTMLIFTILIFVLILAPSALAIGALFSRPIWSDRTYQKVWIKKVTADVDIDGQVAVTHVDQHFVNEMTTTVEAVWVFPLPEGAVVTDLYYWFNNQRYKGSIRERQEAVNDYNERIRQRLDPALLEYLGDNLYRIRIAPVNPESDIRFEMSYVQLLPFDFGSIEYTFLLNAVHLTPKPLEEVRLAIDLNTPSPIKHLESASHGGSTAMQMTTMSDTEARIVYGDEQFTPDQDLSLQFATRRDSVQVHVQRYTSTPEDSIGEESYYAVWITPPDSLTTGEALSKNIVFTADVSSSMEGTRIDQLKTSLYAFLDHLSPQDRFNIVLFGTSTQAFKPDLVAASPENRSNARTFIREIGALGLTNISSALSNSLNQSFSDSSSNMIVFLTDGYPTLGETFLPDIAKGVRDENESRVRIFSFGVGDEVSTSLLTTLAVENGGYFEWIQSDENISTTVENHFMRMSRPVMNDLDIRIDGLKTSDRYPRHLPDLFWSSQVMQLGLYENPGSFPVTLKGLLDGKKVELVSVADFPTTPGGHRYIPRLWAKAKIDYILNQIAMYGELEELVDQVVQLSLTYQILTPYTAFYSDPDESTPVERSPSTLPASFTLYQNHPNPFNPETTIAYDLPAEGHVVLRIYDIRGRLVHTLIDADQTAGAHSLKWDGRDRFGNRVAAGIYLYQIVYTRGDGKQFTLTRKMSLIK
jgi:Ca-activated chloride channel family protein